MTNTYPFLWMDYQKPNLSEAVEADETQMIKPPEPTSHHNARKYLTLLPLRAIYFRSLYYETPCRFKLDQVGSNLMKLVQTC